MAKGAPPAIWSNRRRRQVAALVGAEPENVIFTSGGTEANVLALTPSAAGGALLVSAIEHPSVLAGGRFDPAHVRQVPVTADGRLDLGGAGARRLQAAGRPALVSLMAANNETGVLQPVSEAAALVHAAGGVLHVDAVQAAGRIPLDINAHGRRSDDRFEPQARRPEGRRRADPRARAPALVEPLIRGGGQERGARAGTENVAAIAGFGAAAAAAMAGLAAEAARMAALRDRLERGLRAISPEAIVFGEAAGTAAEHHAVRGARHEGRDRRDRVRPRGRGGVVGRGLLVRQGHTLPRARRHGSSRRRSRAARCASASARPRPNPRSIAFSKLGESCSNH